KGSAPHRSSPARDVFHPKPWTTAWAAARREPGEAPTADSLAVSAGRARRMQCLEPWRHGAPAKLDARLRRSKPRQAYRVRGRTRPEGGTDDPAERSRFVRPRRSDVRSRAAHHG